MSDGRGFDELTRIWAKPMSRRRALRLSAGVVFGAVGATVAGPLRASAVPVGTCTTTANCPNAGECCDNPSGQTNSGSCVTLQPGEVCCAIAGTGGSVHCPSDRCCTGTCLSSGSTCCGGVTRCEVGIGESCCGTRCCAGLTTCCGNTCCSFSKVCVNASTSTCGCASGAAKCGDFCCRSGDTCSDPAGGCCCPKGSTPCGRSCCKSGVACVDRANSICGCPSGTTPCGSGANLTCCPAGQACGSAGCTSPSNNTVAGYCSGVSSDRN